VYAENIVGHGRESLYLDGIMAKWHNVPSRDRRSNCRITCLRSLPAFRIWVAIRRPS